MKPLNIKSLLIYRCEREAKSPPEMVGIDSNRGAGVCKSSYFVRLFIAALKRGRWFDKLTMTHDKIARTLSNLTYSFVVLSLSKDNWCLWRSPNISFKEDDTMVLLHGETVG